MIGSRDSATGRLAVGLGIGVVLATFAMLSLAGVAHAKEEYELNDSRETAYGPLDGGKSYTAEFETDNDVDWYVFYIRAYTQMDFTASEVTECIDENIYFEILDQDGEFVTAFSAGNVDEIRHLRETMNPGRYYFRVYNGSYFSYAACTGERYRFKIEPASAITSNSQCGEAIVARDTAAPLLMEASAELGKTAGAFAAANAAVRESKKDLAKLKRRWERSKARWRKMKRRIQRHPEAPRFQRKERRRLRRSRARLNGALSSSKRSARSELATASETRAEVLAERAPLQTLVTQHTNAKAQAEAQIAASC